MALQINQLEETIQRLHLRLQRATRALYVLHSSGNDEAANIALSRIEQINTRIAELNALLDSFDAPVAQDRDMTTVVPIINEADVPVVDEDTVIIDDPDEDDVEMEYRGTLITAVLAIVVVALFVLFGSRLYDVTSDITNTAAPSVVLEEVTVTAERIVEPVVVKTAAVDCVTYIVQKGDTLWSIAEQHLGTGSAWGTVYGQNVDSIGDNPDLIFPGQVLTITKVSTGSEAIR